MGKLTEEQLNDLLELVEAMQVSNKSNRIEDRVRFDELKEDFIDNWCAN